MSPIFSRDGRRRQFFVYILSNNSMTLYVGVTNDLEKRISQHTAGAGGSFTKRYHFDRLVYFEPFTDIREAIAREKAIKGWNRARKIALIKSLNPDWKDLLSPLQRPPGG